MSSEKKIPHGTSGKFLFLFFDGTQITVVVIKRELTHAIIHTGSIECELTRLRLLSIALWE